MAKKSKVLTNEDIFSFYMSKFHQCALALDYRSAKHYAECSMHFANEFFEKNDIRIVIGYLNYVTVCFECYESIDSEYYYSKIFQNLQDSVNKDKNVLYILGCASFNYSIYCELELKDLNLAINYLEKARVCYEVMVMESPCNVNLKSYEETLIRLIQIYRERCELENLEIVLESYLRLNYE